MCAGFLPEAGAALAVILTLAQRASCLPPSLSVPKLPLPCCRDILEKDEIKHGLFEGVDCYITLSCARDGIRSILCSDFFDPRIPCNLAGSYLCGASKALRSIKRDATQFIAGIRSLRSHTSPLWMAAIWSGSFESVLDSIHGGLWPVKLPVAAWTGTIQSYVQAPIHLPSMSGNRITRAEEYALTFHVRDDATLPLAPYAPFGETCIPNISLDIHPHLRHDHCFRTYMLYWILEDKSKLRAWDRAIYTRPYRSHIQAASRPEDSNCWLR